MAVVEQQYSAELLRQRMRERALQEAAEERTLRAEAAVGALHQTQKDRLPISTLEIGLWLIPAIILDLFEALGALLAVIPFIGIVLAGAAAVVSAIGSGILFLLVGIWLLLKGVSPFTLRGLRIFLLLAGFSFGNAVFSWLPAWTGFFVSLLIMSYKQTFISHGAKHK